MSRREKRRELSYQFLAVLLALAVLISFAAIIGFIGTVVCLVGCIIQAVRKTGTAWKWGIAAVAFAIVGAASGYFIYTARKDKPEPTPAVTVGVEEVSPTAAPVDTTVGGDDEITAFPGEFVSACDEVGIDTALIEGWEQIDDWANGARYRFTYKRHPLYAYMNIDGTVHSIMLGSTFGTAVYLQGYVPYNVENYLVDEDTAMALIPYAEDAVKLALNYPATADFPLLDWTYGREKDLYRLQSTVTAQNGFGVEEEMPFTVIFDLSTEGKAKCVYLELNGSVISSEMPEETEREAVAVPEKSADTPAGTIRLVDGELGEYGRQDPVYPEYVDYYLPAGRYTATGNGKNNIVMVIDNASNDEVSRVTLAAGESGEFEVNENQHIELTIYSDVTLQTAGQKIRFSFVGE